MGYLCLLLLLLCACRHPSHWAFRQIRSEQVSCNSARLTYVSPDPIHGIDLELFHHQEQLTAYLNVHSRSIPASAHPEEAIVVVKVGQETKSFIAQRLEGGQRLVLPQEAAEWLITALKKLDEVSLSVGNYRAHICAEDFADKFETLLKPGLF